MNETRVFQADERLAAELERALRTGLPADAEWRRVDHARFAVKALGASLVCYRSGKVVLQGRDLDGFQQRFLPGLGPGAAAASGAPAIAFDQPTIGADEAGKGDYFGPLVVAAVHAEPGAAAELAAMGVADSKGLSDRRMLPMAERIERTLDCEVRALPPPEYNRRWQEQRNVNSILADLHAEAVGALLRRHPEAMVLVDQFASEDLIGPRLRGSGLQPRRLLQAVRAEAHPVVAAASVVARVHFLEGLARCQDECAVELHKGAGPPVDAAARKVFAVGGSTLLARVAKLHFKNSARVPGLRP